MRHIRTKSNNGLLTSLPEFDVTQIHARNHKNAIVMFSGGIDSTVALWWAIDNYESVRAIIVDYNQPHLVEVEHAERLAKMLDVRYHRIKVDIPKTFWGIDNHLTRGQACLMTSLAALDISHEGADIVEGILRTDMYGDCNREFLDSLATVLFHEDDRNSIGIATPLRAVKDKADVIALGFVYGVPSDLTWTCRDPRGGSPCHSCIQCKQLDSGYEEFYKRYDLDPDCHKEWLRVLGSPFQPLFRNVPYDLSVLAQAFSELGGLKRQLPVWCYEAPDGSRRISSHIHSLEDVKNSSLGFFVNAVSVHGYFADLTRWEVVICENGNIATTEKLPGIEVIQKALLKCVIV